MSKEVHLFRVAELNVRIEIADADVNSISLLKSFEPFRVDSHEGEEVFLTFIIDDTTQPIEKSRRKRIRSFETGNGYTVVDCVDDGGYQFIIKDLQSYECGLIVTNSNFSICRCALNGNFDMRRFGVNNAMMLAFAFAGSFRHALLVHASLVRYDGYGYAFIAKSGTGKSTQVSMWLRHIPGCDLMNDDNPVIRVIDGQAWIYGSPWSGKTPCYRNIKARLGAVTRIDRAPANSIDKLQALEAFASFLPSCSSMKWDGVIYNNICDAVTEVVETTGIYTLHCLPNKEAAEVCFNAITKH